MTAYLMVKKFKHSIGLEYYLLFNSFDYNNIEIAEFKLKLNERRERLNKKLEVTKCRI
jgi:hypothetical protein